MKLSLSSRVWARLGAGIIILAALMISIILVAGLKNVSAEIYIDGSINDLVTFFLLIASLAFVIAALTFANTRKNDPSDRLLQINGLILILAGVFLIVQLAYSGNMLVDEISLEEGVFHAIITWALLYLSLLLFSVGIVMLPASYFYKFLKT